MMRFVSRVLIGRIRGDLSTPKLRMDVGRSKRRPSALASSRTMFQQMNQGGELAVIELAEQFVSLRF